MNKIQEKENFFDFEIQNQAQFGSSFFTCFSIKTFLSPLYSDSKANCINCALQHKTFWSDFRAVLFYFGEIWNSSLKMYVGSRKIFIASVYLATVSLLLQYTPVWSCR